MKKIVGLAIPAALVSLIAASDASADNPVRLNPGVYRYFATQVTGKITLPATQSDAALNGFACSNVSVFATSKDYNPPPAGGGFASPKWTRSANASIVNGECRYTIAVPPGSAFYLTTSGHGNFHCDVIQPIMPNGQIGPVSVPFLQTRTENINVTSVLCEVLK